jgi:hypothetical protein
VGSRDTRGAAAIRPERRCAAVLGVIANPLGIAQTSINFL